MKRSRIIAWFPLSLLLALAALTFWLDRKVQPPPPRLDGSARHDPDYVVDNFSATRLGPDGHPRHVLSAAKMTHYPDDDSTRLESPHFTQFNGPDDTIQAWSLQGLISSNGDNVFLMDNVLLKQEGPNPAKAIRMTTSFLHVVPDANLAQTDRPVTITDPNTIIHAIGLEFNNKTHVLKLLKQVNAQYTKPPGK